MEKGSTRTTELSNFGIDKWHGVPSIVDLGGHRIGALHPDVENDITKVMLSVFSW